MINRVGELRIGAALPEAAGRSVTDTDVHVTCPRCARDWPMDRAYIATRSGSIRYSCPTCDILLAFVEQTPDGITYGVPHGVFVDRR
jgi:uncharacterized C2H2 Zn-finger protein